MQLSSSLRMPTYPDIVVHSPFRRAILLAECTRSKDASAETAARLREIVLEDIAVPEGDGAFFMLTFPTVIYLWAPGSAPNALPAYSAPAVSLMREYLGRIVDQPGGPLKESLQLATAAWLFNLTGNLREPSKTSEADQMLVASGLYDMMKDAYVHTEFSR